MKYYLYCFFLLVSSFVFSQSQKTLSDSEYQKLHDKARILLNSHIDSSFFYANKIEQSNSNLHKSFAFGIKSYIYQLKGDSISSKKYYKTSIVYLNKLKPSNEKTKLHAYLLNYKGLSERIRGNLNNAVRAYQEGLQISLKVNDELQISKFYYNLSYVYQDLENFNLAIKTGKIADTYIENIKLKLDENQFFNQKSNINLALGNSYFNKYKQNKEPVYLDSSYTFYKNALNYSDELLLNKIMIYNNLASILICKKKYREAEKIYNSSLSISIENNLQDQVGSIYYNLGRLNFTLKDFNKAKLFFLKYNSIYKVLKINNSDYVFSNYHLAKIYDAENEKFKAKMHSSIFLEELKNYSDKSKREEIEINYNINSQKIESEVHEIYQTNKNKITLIYLLGVLALIGLSLFFYFNYKKRKKAELKVISILNEFKLKNNLEENKTPINLAIDSDTEIKILLKLEKLEAEKFYLKSDFTQQEVAKKIKTNTTYLSYVVNKNYNKTFSAHYNELRINYVINEIINNKKYREYTTLAIAESAGFKNADSFTSSFKKKTGITPFNFINEIKKREL
jgi:tetratricopeptide (TPR) repeat protein